MSGLKLTIAAAAVIAVLLIVGGTAAVTAWLAYARQTPTVLVVPQPAVSAEVVPPRGGGTSVRTVPARVDFPMDVWTPSPFDAVRWPTSTPQVMVNGTWYELEAVNGVPTDRIIRLILKQPGVVVSCYQMRFESDLLNYVNQLDDKPMDFRSATLEVKNPATGQTQALPNVLATAANRGVLLRARQRTDAPGRPMATVLAAIAAMEVNNTDDLFICFDSIDNSQREQLAHSIRYPQMCIQIEDEISQQFTHEAVGAADHFFKPRWWLQQLNEFDAEDSSKIDLRSLGLGQMTLHKTPDAWKIDPAWITQNADGLDRLNRFVPNLLEFESRLKAGKYQTAEELQNGIQALSRQLDAAIPKPPPEP